MLSVNDNDGYKIEICGCKWAANSKLDCVMLRRFGMGKIESKKVENLFDFLHGTKRT